ncbi:peptidoglycan-binding domain-containing protein [Leptospira bandrabouensis]|uniref:peptidoglycan-binding domain-containing protein n=1 Tax=Leptospira bandrabouensis TaxID=2484903 RepID=UPI001EEBAC37|nr:peptidoglycan-binding domain-containing protein [Leptospira bandrabouensis]MCG6152600.1 peptidoglycan-binding protein [Leptospira bandrabouensis]
MTQTYPTIRQGSTGPTVTFLQKNLITLGYGSILSSDGKDGADGIFGSNTTKAVRDFQIKHALEVDGVVGEETWGKILSLVPSTDILVNTIQATVQPVPSATAPKPPEPSLPIPSAPPSVQVTDTRIPPEKSNTLILGTAVGIALWYMFKPNRRKRR